MSQSDSDALAIWLLVPCPLKFAIKLNKNKEIRDGSRMPNI